MCSATARRSILVIAILAATGTEAAEPSVRNVNVRGLQIGGTTTITIDGDEFGTAPRLLLPFAAKQQLKPNPTKTQVVFDVTVDETVEPGYHQLRVVTDDGVSTPVVIAVDRLPQRPITATTDQWPAALHGTVVGSAAVETKFVGKSGQKLLAEVEAQRLGGKPRPVVRLVGPNKRQLAWAWPTPSLFGDTRLEVTLPEDGTYTVLVHDVEYAAPAPGFFRLRLGQWSFADQVFPPAVEKGRAQKLELLGDGSALTVDMAAVKAAGPTPVSPPKDAIFSGPRPVAMVSPHAEVARQVAADKVQDLPPGPVGVSGRLLEADNEHRYRVPVTPKTKVRFEVFAERIRSPIDVGLVVRNEQGGEVARAEDSQGTIDPAVEYAVPDNVNAVVVAVVDSQGRGGPRAVYRLVVTPPQTGPDKSGFQLTTPAQRINLPVGGSAVVPVLIDRRGYEGRVELSAEGVTLEGADIPEGADGALVTVRRGEAFVGAVVSRLTGRAADGEDRMVVTKNHPLERLQPWLATELAVAATTAKASDFQIDWRGLPPDAGLVPAAKLTLPVKVTRPEGKEVVRLTLLTSQLRPVVNGQTDPNQALRLEKPVELAGPVTDGDLTVLVPPTPQALMYDVTVQADLLTVDKTKVLATAFAPVRRMKVRHQLALKLDGPSLVEATLDPKAPTTVKVSGQVERREGFAGDVTVTLTGLPAGVRADPVTVKAADTAFAVNVILPPTTPPAEMTGLKLSSTGVPDAKQPNVRVSSRDLQLGLVVRSTAK